MFVIIISLIAVTRLFGQQEEIFEYTDRNDTITFISDSEKIGLYWVFKTDTSAKAIIFTGLTNTYKLEFIKSKPVKLFRGDSLIATLNEAEVVLGDKVYDHGDGTYKSHWGFFHKDSVVLECFYEMKDFKRLIHFESTLTGTDLEILKLLALQRGVKIVKPKSKLWVVLAFGGVVAGLRALTDE